MQENVQTDDMEKRAQYGNAVRTFRLSRELIDALDRECAREGRRYDAPDCPPGTPTPRADLIRRLLWEALASRGCLGRPEHSVKEIWRGPVDRAVPESLARIYPQPDRQLTPQELSAQFGLERQIGYSWGHCFACGYDGPGLEGHVCRSSPKSDSRSAPSDPEALPDP